MIRSPLRYPGGKSRLADTIIDNFLGQPDNLLSPFIGGGSIELKLAARGTYVVGFDSDPYLVRFWQTLAARGFSEFFSQEFAKSLDRGDWIMLAPTSEMYFKALKQVLLSRDPFNSSNLTAVLFFFAKPLFFQRPWVPWRFFHRSRSPF